MTEKFRGHPVEYDGTQWVYSDDKTPTVEGWKERPCGHCGKHMTPEGHDGCLGTLPGLMNACCGHGVTNEAYVQFMDGACVRGKGAVTIMDVLKGEGN